MKMNDRVRVAVTWFLMNNVDRLPVNVEGQGLGECNAGTVDCEFGEPSRQRCGRTHYVAPYSLQRILMHGHERAAWPHSCITSECAKSCGAMTTYRIADLV